MSFSRYHRTVITLLAITLPALAHADPAGDEARRQASMANAQASAANIDRQNADRAFQAGLSQRSSGASGGGSSSASSASSTASSSTRNTSGGSAVSDGPQSVVARRTYTVWVGETLAQAAVRLGREAAGGNAQSQYALGRMYYCGYGVTTNLVEARRLFIAAAAQNHIEGSLYAGQFQINGLGGPIDLLRGKTNLFTAAEAGNSDAQASLGVEYVKTSIQSATTTQMPRAMTYLTRAAEAGSALAQSTLGTLVYYFGIGDVPVDGAKAVQYMRMAAAQGEPMSMYYLGNLMLNGDAWTGENRTEGWSLVSRAAAAGNGRAMWLLGTSKFNGARGQQKDEAAGQRLVRQSAEAGDRNGQHVWGLMQYAGIGRAENKAEGLRYMRLSADQSYPEALVFMGKSYYFGDVGITKNLTEAARFARLAAESGSAEGQAFYGKLLWAGEGVTQDRRQAASWIKQAADQGDAASINDLKDPELIALLPTNRK